MSYYYYHYYYFYCVLSFIVVITIAALAFIIQTYLDSNHPSFDNGNMAS